MKKTIITLAFSLALLPASAQMWTFDSAEELEKFLLTAELDTTTTALDMATKNVQACIKNSADAVLEGAMRPTSTSILNIKSKYDMYVDCASEFENQQKQFEMNKLCKLMKELLLKYKKDDEQ